MARGRRQTVSKEAGASRKALVGATGLASMLKQSSSKSPMAVGDDLSISESSIAETDEGPCDDH